MNAFVIIVTLLLVAFPTGKSKILKKGERWDIGCMDIDLSVHETTVKVGETWVPDVKKVTITCNSAGKAKAYFTCPSNTDADADPPEVLCK